MVGLFSVLREPFPPGYPGNSDKINNISVGFSRDGFHWHRPEREPVVDVSGEPDTWNASNVQSAGGCFLVVGDELFIYCSARGGGTDGELLEFSTGLATMRRDGFASMDAGEGGGTLTTRPVRFSGNHLFVNVKAPRGRLTAEVLDREGRVVPQLSRENCVPVTGDATCAPVHWKQDADLSLVAGSPVRFRLHLESGSLYALWVSPDPSGASSGFVAAGGPQFNGPTDS